MPTTSGAAKLKEVTSLLDKLSSDLRNTSLSSQQRDEYLERLKVLGRDPTNADPIFTKEGIETLSGHAFGSPSRDTSRNALRCLANALLLNPQSRQIFVDLRCESKICGILKNHSLDYEFLASRIIFLTTYLPGLDIEGLIDKHELASHICTNLSRHAARNTDKERDAKDLDQMEEMALIETSKLLFNLTHFCPQRQANFSPALPHILSLLSNRLLTSSKPLDSVVGALVNALINVQLDLNTATLFPETSRNSHVDNLVAILDKSLKSYANKELEQVLPPLVALLRRIYQLAPIATKNHLQVTLLPSTEDRAHVLGKGTSLSSRLLQLTNNPSTPSLRETVSRLLFELSDEDATTFVRNIGYGLASGFLFQNKIAIPSTALEHNSNEEGRASNSTSGQGTSQGGHVNPITGQFLDKEVKSTEVEMTEEEKEREAERLFVLFERLRKTGVMNVENPVMKAFQEGRFEELPDGDDD